jgi:hypothetical protein
MADSLRVRTSDFITLENKVGTLESEVKKIREGGCLDRPNQYGKMNDLEQDIRTISDQISLIIEGKSLLFQSFERRILDVEREIKVMNEEGTIVSKGISQRLSTVEKNQQEMQIILYKATGMFTAIVTIVTLLAKYL